MQGCEVTRAPVHLLLAAATTSPSSSHSPSCLVSCSNRCCCLELLNGRTQWQDGGHWLVACQLAVLEAAAEAADCGNGMEVEKQEMRLPKKKIHVGL